MKYKDKLTGKELTFTPKPDEVMVKFSEDADLLDATTDFEARGVLTPLHEAGPARRYGCYRILADAESADTLSQAPGIESVFPVVIDNEGNERYFLPGELTVQFKEGVTDQDQESIIAECGCTIIRKQRTPGYYTLGLPPDRDLFEAIEEFNALDAVAFAEPSNVGYHDALYLPGDPDFGQQWYLHNTGQTGGTPDSDVDAPEGWNMERGDPGMAIAIIDTGVDLGHPDLAANIVPRPPGEDWDFADPDDVPDPGPEWWEDHGTHCAGIAAAVDNNTGIVGLAPSCSILPIRVDLHGGAYQNRADAINFVTSIASRFTHVVMSCSWRTTGDVAAIHNAIVNANNNNILVCFAAGNDNANTDDTPKYPGVMPEVLSVAAIDHKDVRASFSNYGSTVDVSAPGVNIYSTLPSNGHGMKDGTSMACPLVAGLAGLVWSKNSSLTNQQVRDIIEANCDDVDGANEPKYHGKLGAGRINAYQTLKRTPGMCRFKVAGSFNFPQPNAGSSSALTLYARPDPSPCCLPRPVPRRHLLFLTQKPYSERIFFLDPTSGAVIRSIDPHANDTIGSMTWDGKVIRVANVTTGSGCINAINPTDGSQVGSIPAPPGRGEGMTYDGRRIFYSTDSRIHEMDPSTGAVIRSFPVPGGGRCRALASDGRSLLFSGDPFTSQITVFEKVSLAIVCRFDAPGESDHRVDGLAYDPWTKTLYIANQTQNLIYHGTLA